MHRQSPARNQRSRGIGVKHFVQYSLMLGVCFWLLYQLKHSAEKNISQLKSEVSGSPERLPIDEILRLARKGILESFDERLSTANTEEIHGDNRSEEGDAGLEEDEGDDEHEKNEEGDSGAEDEETEVSNPIEDEAWEDEADEEEEDAPEARKTNHTADGSSTAVAHDSQRKAAGNETGSSVENDAVKDSEKEDGSEKGNEKSSDTPTGNNSTELGTANHDAAITNATEGTSAENDETGNIELGEGSDLPASGSSNSTVSDETTDSLDEKTMEEEEDMGRNEDLDEPLIEDKSTSEANDTLHETMDTIQDILTGGAKAEGATAE